MSRARDMANLGDQAGSGLDASDLTTGTLGNTVQDNITRLGTVTTGTMKNTIHSDATFPAGSVIYADNFSFTSTEAGSDPGTTWTPTSLQIQVPSATIAKISKVYINVFNVMYIQKAASAAIASTRILRTVNSVDTEICRANLIGTHDASYPDKVAINASISGMDKSLGSSSYDHVYTVQYRSSHVNYSANIYYHGVQNYTNVPIVNISVLGIV